MITAPGELPDRSHLRDGLATGLADDIERWWEWEQASHGRRQLTWSRGLREPYGLRDAQADEEIAAEDMRTDDLIALPAPTWDAVRDRAELLLGAAEVDGLDAACRWLGARGLAWSWGDSGPAARTDHTGTARTTCVSEIGTRSAASRAAD